MAYETTGREREHLGSFELTAYKTRTGIESEGDQSPTIFSDQSPIPRIYVPVLERL